MSATQKTVRLKQSEIMQILSLIEQRQQEGWYYGNKKQFEKREATIEAKLITASRTRSNT